LKPQYFSFLPRSLGEHLKARRFAKNLPAKDVALLLGVSPWTLINWETGETSPAEIHYPAILSFLDFDPFQEPGTLAGQLRAFRRKRGLSVKAAAPLLSVDEATWRGWEAGRRPADFHIKRLKLIVSV
jgi:DNA-binding transcriptional regulator YiaG